MNKARRKTIANILGQLETVLPILKKALEAEKEAYKQIPDDEENEERKDAVDELIDNLDSAISSLEDAINTLSDTDF